MSIAQALPQPAVRVFDAWNHQLEAYHFAHDKRAAMLAMAMGTGKSKVASDLLVNRGHRKILVLAPASVLAVWRRELATHAPQIGDVLILDGSYGSVKDKTEAAALTAHITNRTVVVVINYESARCEAFAQWAVKQRWDLVVCDESHRLKSAQGKASKFVATLGESAGTRLCLTGTPMPHSPLDVFGQYRFLDPSIFGKYYTKFRARYAVGHKMFPSKVVKWINQDELHEKMFRIAYKVGADVLDLPPVMHERRTFKLDNDAFGVYRDLRDEMIAQISRGEVRVDNALVKLLRLQQITSGFVVNGEGEEIELDRGKRLLLSDLLSDLDKDEPVVVFCRFKRDLETVRQVCLEHGRRFGELSGRQKDLTEHARMPESVDVLAVQWQSGGVGIDLTRAAYCVMFSQTFSLGDYDQALARTHRPGQLRTVRYYHLIADGTVDEHVYDALSKRREVVEAVLSDFLEENKI